MHGRRQVQLRFEMGEDGGGRFPHHAHDARAEHKERL